MIRYVRFLFLLTWIALLVLVAVISYRAKAWSIATTTLFIALILACNAPQSWHLARTRD